MVHQILECIHTSTQRRAVCKCLHFDMDLGHMVNTLQRTVNARDKRYGNIFICIASLYIQWSLACMQCLQNNIIILQIVDIGSSAVLTLQDNMYIHVL